MKQFDDVVLVMDEPNKAQNQTLNKTEVDEKKTDPNPKKPEKKKRKGLAGKICLYAGTVFLFLLVCVVIACYVLLNGPSTTMRDALVLSAKQASATKWIPALFLDDELVRQIEENSKTVTYDVVSMEDVTPPSQEEEKDEWADAIDGLTHSLVTLCIQAKMSEC